MNRLGNEDNDDDNDSSDDSGDDDSDNDDSGDDDNGYDDSGYDDNDIYPLMIVAHLCYVFYLGCLFSTSNMISYG